MSAQSRSYRWIRLWSILLLLGAMLLAPAFAGGEDDPAVGGKEAASTSEPSDPIAPDPPLNVTDWLLWWLTLGLLL